MSETVFSSTAGRPDSAIPMQALEIVSTSKLANMDLVSEITPKIISVSAADPDRMSVDELAALTRHLSENGQESQRYRIAFWKTLIDLLAVFVLMALALPFSYMQSRSGGVSIKIFAGIMIGLAYMLVNGVIGHVGMLSAMPPLVTAILPSLVFLGLALGALWRVERRG